VRKIRPPRHPHRLFTPAEEHRIVAAIQHAEHETSGLIRIHVEAHCPGDATARAQAVFSSLGMDEKAERNGVLIYLATRDRKFALVGDEGIHKRVPPAFWDEVRDAMAVDFRQGRFAEGVCHGIAAVANHLKAYFPAAPK